MSRQELVKWAQGHKKMNTKQSQGNKKNNRTVRQQRRRQRNVRQPKQRTVVKYVDRPIRNPPKEKSMGEKIGGFIGHGLGQVVKAITGFGDYKVDENTLMTGIMNPPEIKNVMDKGGFIVRHREYVADVLATTAFTITSYDINPGLINSYPWLSQVAQAFEEYNFRGLVYEFKSMSSDAVLSSATSSALGTVIMATQYNSLYANFPDKKSMENYEYANSSKPSESFMHPVECKKNQTPTTTSYIRVGAVPTNADQRFYDLGNFQIATQGMQANGGVCGELWATFEIELYKPKLLTDQGQVILTDHYQLSGVTSVAPFGTSSTLVIGSLLGTSITVSGTTIQFPVGAPLGNYLVTYSVNGTAGIITPPVLTANGGVFKKYWNNDTTFSQMTPSLSTAATYMESLIYAENTLGGTIVASGAVLPTLITTGDLWITQINSAIGS